VLIPTWMRERINSDDLFLSEGNDSNNRLFINSRQTLSNFNFRLIFTTCTKTDLWKMGEARNDLEGETRDRNIITELRSRIRSVDSNTLLQVKLSRRKGRVIRVTKIPTYKSVRFVHYECDQSDSRSYPHEGSSLKRARIKLPGIVIPLFDRANEKKGAISCALSDIYVATKHLYTSNS